MSTSIVADAPRFPEPLLITAEEFADLMQISIRTLWRLKSAGSVPEPVRIGGTVRWRRDQVRQWIEAGCPQTTSRENERRRT